MSFKEDFSKIPFGPNREQLVYRGLINKGKPTDLWPVTVDGPNGTKVTYYITRDFLNVDGFYTPMSGTTAQKLADYFGMFLPTNKISDQVWKAAPAKITVHPLSGTGYQGTDKFYSPNEVVATRINATDAAIAFNENIQKARDQQPATLSQLTDIGSGAKWLTVPPSSGSLGLHGIRQSNDPKDLAQAGYGTTHQDYENHTEYGVLVRLVDNIVTITYPDGHKENVSMKEFLKRPERTALYEEGQDLRDGKLARYDLNRDKAQLSKIDAETGSVKNQESQVAQNEFSDEKIDKFLKELNQQFSSAASNNLPIKKITSQSLARMKLLSRVAEFTESDNNLVETSKIVTPDQYQYQPGVMPPGYGSVGFKGRAPKPIEDVAKNVLKLFLANKYPIGTMVPFTVDNQEYMARAEIHSNSPYGISVYQAISSSSKEDSSVDQEKSIDEFLKKLQEQINY